MNRTWFQITPGGKWHLCDVYSGLVVAFCGLQSAGIGPHPDTPAPDQQCGRCMSNPRALGLLTVKQLREQERRAEG